MGNTDRARKLFVRTAFATGTTLATLVGAQNFALLDLQTFQNNVNVEDNVVASIVETPTVRDLSLVEVTPELIITQQSEVTINKSQPNIMILRHSGSGTTSTTIMQNNTTNSIQPPAPSVLSAPDPVIIQQPSEPQYIVIQQPAAQSQPVVSNQQSSSSSQSSNRSQPSPQRSNSSR